jgi:hypothetical protein
MTERRKIIICYHRSYHELKTLASADRREARGGGSRQPAIAIVYKEATSYTIIKYFCIKVELKVYV